MALITDHTLITYNAYTDIIGMDFVMTQLNVVQDNAFWTALTDQDKENLILFASDAINQVIWKGSLDPTVIAPDMYWPRTGVTYRNGIEVPVGTIPDELIWSMACWIKKNYYTAGSSTTSTVTAGAVKSKKVGDLAVTYETNADIISAQAQSIAATSGGGLSGECISYVTYFIEALSTGFGDLGDTTALGGDSGFLQISTAKKVRL